MNCCPLWWSWGKALSEGTTYSPTTFAWRRRSLPVWTPPVRQKHYHEGGNSTAASGQQEVMWLTLLVVPRQWKPSPTWLLRQVQFLLPCPKYSQRAYLLQSPLFYRHTVELWTDVLSDPEDISWVVMDTLWDWTIINTVAALQLSTAAPQLFTDAL